MRPAMPDQPASTAGDRPDAPAPAADAEAGGSRSPSPAPSDTAGRAAPAVVEATSTETTEPSPENDPPRALTLPAKSQPQTELRQLGGIGVSGTHSIAGSSFRGGLTR